MKFLFFSTFFLIFLSYSFAYDGDSSDSSDHDDCIAPEPVQDFDPSKYVGVWYEIKASKAVRQTIEAGCKCVRATYSASDRDNVINVENYCLKNGEPSIIKGTAEADSTTPSMITVTFPVGPPPTAPNYIVSKLISDSDGYAMVLVSSKCKDSDSSDLWILARSPNPPFALVEEVTAYALANGFEGAYTFTDSDQSCSSESDSDNSSNASSEVRRK